MSSHSIHTITLVESACAAEPLGSAEFGNCLTQRRVHAHEFLRAIGALSK
jgi:hypothetical protein